jgi:hypothetical protein
MTVDMSALIIIGAPVPNCRPDIPDWEKIEVWQPLSAVTNGPGVHDQLLPGARAPETAPSR